MNAASHPRLLSDFTWRSTKKFRAVLTRDCTVDLRKGLRGCHEFYDPNEFRFATLEDDRLTMMMGLASDLTSPAVCICGKWVGAPAGPQEALGAFVHDTTRRILKAGCVKGISRKVTDDLYFDFCNEAKSRWTKMFHAIVAGPVGSLWMAANDHESVYCPCHKTYQP